MNGIIPLMFVGLGMIRSSIAFESRIVNGSDAQDKEFPFAVSLRRSNSHTCGSTILNEKFILTAAHCVCNDNEPLDAKFYSVQYGLTTISAEPKNTINASKIYCNDFNMTTLLHDAAVVELNSPLPEDGSWETVKLDCSFDSSKERDGVIIGWGRISHDGPLSERLQKLAVKIYDDGYCGKHFNLKHHICFGAESAGACNGDSGTALLVDGAQVGIASFINAKCGVANKEFPNIYSRVTTYCDWIEEKAGKVQRIQHTE